MAIHGELTELDVPGLLQLISTHGKSGTLVVQGADEHEVHVLFEDGDIVAAEVSERGEPQRLGELLVKAEALSAEDLEWALREQKARGMRLGDLLVTEGKIDKQDLADILRVQVYETIFRVFTWKQGRFELRQGLPDFERGVMQRIRTDHVLMDSFRMVDEWPQIKRWVPSFDRIVERTEIGEKVRRPLSAPTGDAGGLTEAEWLMLGFAAEHLSVQRAIYRSRLGEFESCKALKGLQEKGLVRLVVAGEALTKRLMLGKSRRWNASGALAVLNVVLGVMAVALAVAILGPAVMGAGQGQLLELALGAGGGGGLAGEIVDARARAVRESLELYRVERGSYPDALERLVETGLVTHVDLDLVTRKYRYDGPARGQLAPREPVGPRTAGGS